MKICHILFVAWLISRGVRCRNDIWPLITGWSYARCTNGEGTTTKSRFTWDSECMGLIFRNWKSDDVIIEGVKLDIRGMYRDSFAHSTLLWCPVLDWYEHQVFLYLESLLVFLPGDILKLLFSYEEWSEKECKKIALPFIKNCVFKP